MPLPRESVSSSQGLRIGVFTAMPQATVMGAESARPNFIITPTIPTGAATADQTAMARAADSIPPRRCTSAASAAPSAFTAARPAKARAAPSILSGFTILLDPRDSHQPQTNNTPMPFKFIVKIEKGGIAMEVEVMARDANEAKAQALRLYPGYRLAAGMWRINPSDGKRVLCG